MQCTCIERMQCHPSKIGGHVFLVTTVLLQNVYNLQTELGKPKNMAADLPGMTLHPLYTPSCICMHACTGTPRGASTDFQKYISISFCNHSLNVPE